MIGIENITSNNGWALAAVGATIVFSGLVVLVFVISQIHKLLKLWDDREKLIERFKKKAPTNFLLMHGMACNSSGVIGSAICAGILWSFFV